MQYSKNTFVSHWFGKYHQSASDQSTSCKLYPTMQSTEMINNDQSVWLFVSIYFFYFIKKKYLLSSKYYKTFSLFILHHLALFYAWCMDASVSHRTYLNGKHWWIIFAQDWTLAHVLHTIHKSQVMLFVRRHLNTLRRHLRRLFLSWLLSWTLASMLSEQIH